MGMYDQQLAKYKAVIENFVKKENGHFIVFSNDFSVKSTLRKTLTTHLGVTDEDIMTVVTDEEKIEGVVEESWKRTKNILAFVEMELNEKGTAFFIKNTKSKYDGFKVIALCQGEKREKNTLMLFHEMGADNFMIKPVSADGFIEKIARVVAPKGKVGKLLEVARRLVDGGEYEKALEVCGAVLEVKPDNAMCYFISGDAREGLGNKDEAIKAYEKAGGLANMFFAPLEKLAGLYKKEKKFEQQLEYLEKLDDLSPLNLERKVDMGEAHFRLDNTSVAEELFEQAMKKANREILDFLDDISIRIGNVYAPSDPETAAFYYRKALDNRKRKLTKADIATFNLLGIALRKQGKWKEALDEYNHALKIDPEDGHLYYNMAMACAEGKQFYQASEYVEGALERNPDFYEDDATISFNIGLIFSKLGDKGNARMFLNHALTLRPSFESPKRLLARLDGGSPEERAH